MYHHCKVYYVATYLQDRRICKIDGKVKMNST